MTVCINFWISFISKFGFFNRSFSNFLWISHQSCGFRFSPGDAVSPYTKPGLVLVHFFFGILSSKTIEYEKKEERSIGRTVEEEEEEEEENRQFQQDGNT